MSTPRRMTERELRQLVERGRAGFQRALAENAKDTAKRLLEAYKRVDREIPKITRAIKAASSEAEIGQVARDVKGEITRSLEGLTRAIEQAARATEREGVAQGVEWAGSALKAQGITSWAQPAVAQIQGVAGIVDSPAFRATLNQYAPYHGQTVADTILSMSAQGKNPNVIAGMVRNYLGDMPFFDAARMTRTAQLWGARTGTREIWRANRDVVLGWTWGSAADTRTCVGCWAMHGTRHGVDEMLNDHHQGRCAMIPITPGWSEFGLAGVDVQAVSGEAIFRALPADQQKKIMGKGMWAAWKDGAFQFGSMSETYTNNVYGEMRRGRSLESLAGREVAMAYRGGKSPSDRPGGIPTSGNTKPSIGDVGNFYQTVQFRPDGGQ